MPPIRRIRYEVELDDPDIDTTVTTFNNCSVDELLSGNGVLVVSTRWLRFFSQLYDWTDTAKEYRPAPEARKPNVVPPLYEEPLDKLFECCQVAPAVKIMQTGSPASSDPSHVNIGLFRAVRLLQLRRVDVRWLHGLYDLRDRIQHLVVYKCVDTLDDVLVTFGGDRLHVVAITAASVLATPSKSALTSVQATPRRPSPVGDGSTHHYGTTTTTTTTTTTATASNSKSTGNTERDAARSGTRLPAARSSEHDRTNDGGGVAGARAGDGNTTGRGEQGSSAMQPPTADHDVGAEDEAEEQWLALRILDASNNAITQIPSSLQRASQLHTLILSGNDIYELCVELAHVPLLHTLALSFNRISSLTPFKDIVQAGGLKKLTHLSLSTNNITSLDGLQHLENLASLDIANNPVSSLHDIDKFLAPLPLLRQLDMRGAHAMMQTQAPALTLALFGRRWKNMILNDTQALEVPDAYLVPRFIQALRQPRGREQLLGPSPHALRRHHRIADPTRAREAPVVQVMRLKQHSGGSAGGGSSVGSSVGGGQGRGGEGDVVVVQREGRVHKAGERGFDAGAGSMAAADGSTIPLKLKRKTKRKGKKKGKRKGKKRAEEEEQQQHDAVAHTANVEVGAVDNRHLARPRALRPNIMDTSYDDELPPQPRPPRLRKDGTSHQDREAPGPGDARPSADDSDIIIEGADTYRAQLKMALAQEDEPLRLTSQEPDVQGQSAAADRGVAAVEAVNPYSNGAESVIQAQPEQRVREKVHEAGEAEAQDRKGSRMADTDTDARVPARSGVDEAWRETNHGDLSFDEFVADMSRGPHDGDRPGAGAGVQPTISSPLHRPVPSAGDGDGADDVPAFASTPRRSQHDQGADNRQPRAQLLQHRQPRAFTVYRDAERSEQQQHGDLAHRSQRWSVDFPLPEPPHEQGGHGVHVPEELVYAPSPSAFGNSRVRRPGRLRHSRVKKRLFATDDGIEDKAEKRATALGIVTTDAQEDVGGHYSSSNRDGGSGPSPVQSQRHNGGVDDADGIAHALLQGVQPHATATRATSSEPEASVGGGGAGGDNDNDTVTAAEAPGESDAARDESAVEGQVSATAPDARREAGGERGLDAAGDARGTADHNEGNTPSGRDKGAHDTLHRHDGGGERVAAGEDEGAGDDSDAGADDSIDNDLTALVQQNEMLLADPDRVRSNTGRSARRRQKSLVDIQPGIFFVNLINNKGYHNPVTLELTREHLVSRKEDGETRTISLLDLDSVERIDDETDGSYLMLYFSFTNDNGAKALKFGVDSDNEEDMEMFEQLADDLSRVVDHNAADHQRRVSSPTQSTKQQAKDAFGQQQLPQDVARPDSRGGSGCSGVQEESGVPGTSETEKTSVGVDALLDLTRTVRESMVSPMIMSEVETLLATVYYEEDNQRTVFMLPCRFLALNSGGRADAPNISAQSGDDDDEVTHPHTTQEVLSGLFVLTQGYASVVEVREEPKAPLSDNDHQGQHQGDVEQDSWRPFAVALCYSHVRRVSPGFGFQSISFTTTSNLSVHVVFDSTPNAHRALRTIINNKRALTIAAEAYNPDLLDPVTNKLELDTSPLSGLVTRVPHLEQLLGTAPPVPWSLYVLSGLSVNGSAMHTRRQLLLCVVERKADTTMIHLLRQRATNAQKVHVLHSLDLEITQLGVSRSAPLTIELTEEDEDDETREPLTVMCEFPSAAAAIDFCRQLDIGYREIFEVDLEIQVK